MKKAVITFLQLIPVILSLLAIGAHFLRSANYAIAGMAIALIFALFIKHELVVKVVQIVLFLSAIEWARTIYTIASFRMDIGSAWARMALILGFVAIFTFASIFVFRSKIIKERYKL